MTDVDVEQPAAEVLAAVRATYSVFIGAGFAFASWASRIPQVRRGLGLTPGELGLLLLAIAAGSVLALPISGLLVDRINARRTVTLMSLLLATALVVVGVGYLGGVLPVAIGLFLLGLANGAWDVAMNVQGAQVERRLGRAIMPRFHAGYSLGTVIGALLGAAMVALHVPVTAHLVATGVIVALVVPYVSRGFLPDASAATADPTTNEPEPARGALTRWLEPRTIMIGLFVLAFAFAEGAGNDWISVALIDGYHVAAAIGSLGYAVFLSAMTIARWVGPSLLNRFGRVAVIRSLALVAIVGLLLFVFGAHTPIAFVGALLWGVGVSLGFPVGMSAAADDPAAAAGRVGVVASIGYCAFLGGPPLIGFLGSQVGVLDALTAVTVLIAVAAVLASSLRPRTD